MPRRDGFSTGFYGALGAAYLGLLLLALWGLLGVVAEFIPRSWSPWLWRCCSTFPAATTSAPPK